MPNRSSRDLTTLDFDSVKKNLTEYLRSQSIFKDYDFEGSNINVLLDVLSYNTNLHSFYLNMIANEMFLDSALLRDSIVSHAKELNYLPRSFRSAVARVNIYLSGSPDDGLIIPRGTKFTGTGEGRNFSFVTSENISLTGENGDYVAEDVNLYEGNYTYDSYTINDNNPSRYLISNKTVDTNSITVTVLEDNGESTIPYFSSKTLFGLDSTSPVFFIQPAENESYEIVFGDGIIGRRPKDRSVVLIQYRMCNGELPNGIRRFVSNSTDINGMTVQSVETLESARGGSIPESLSSIKNNAPRAFTTQERVVTASDYETMLTTNFSEINAVSAYGGEEADPPRFGKVIVAVDLKTSDSLPQSRIREYTNFILPRSPLSLQPIFVEPDYTYVQVKSNVKYNINLTPLKAEDIRTIVESTIQNYNQIFLNGFNKTLYYSRLIADIDDSQLSIVSNDTELFAIKTFVPTVQSEENYTIDFGMQLNNDIALIRNIRKENKKTIITSSEFYMKDMRCTIEDDGDGVIRIMTKNINPGQLGKMLVKEIGEINYESGVIKLNKFNPSRLINNEIALYARTFERDITAKKRTILSVRDEDIHVNVEQVRL